MAQERLVFEFLNLSFSTRWLSRIQTAVTDSQNKIIFPLKTILRTANNFREIGQQIASIAQEHQSQAVIIGIPLDKYNPNYITDMGSRIITYAREIWIVNSSKHSIFLDLPIVFQNESFSTQEVLQEIEGRTDFDHKKMKQNLRPKDQVFLDSLAAKKILERGLQEIHRTIELMEKEQQQHSEKKE